MLDYNRIKEIIRNRGLTVRELAEMLGYEYSGLYKAMQNNSLKYDARVKLAEILGVTQEQLEGEIGKESEYLKQLGPEDRVMDKMEDFYARNPGEGNSILKKLMASGPEKRQLAESSLSFDAGDSAMSDYRFLVESMKEDLRSRDTMIRVQQEMIADLRNEADRLRRRLEEKSGGGDDAQPAGK